MVAGVLYGAEQTQRRNKPELILLTFTTRGTALVPLVGPKAGLRAAVGPDAHPTRKNAVGAKRLEDRNEPAA